MQKAMILSAVALALSAGSAMAQADEDLVGAKLPSALTFDGFCDGLSGITKNSATGPSGKVYTIYTGAYSLANCGASDIYAEGASGNRIGAAGSGAAMTADLQSFVGVPYVVTFVIKTNKTWFLYDSSGYGFVNDGTWTAAGAAKSHGTKAAALAR